MTDPTETRAVPLPEERAVEGDADRRAEAAEILEESEERISEAATARAPRDAAEEHRTSDEGVH